MTKTKTVSVFAIVAVTAMLGASSIAPAYAAQKFVDYHDQDESLVNEYRVNPCSGSPYVDVYLVTNTFLKVWDNGKFKFHDDAHYNLYEAGSLSLVGTVPLKALNMQGDIEDLPISGNFNSGGVGQCLDGTTFPAYPDIHCGATLQKDGDLIEHSTSCF